MILSGSIYFLISLNELNTIDGMPTTIKIPFMDSDNITSNGYNISNIEIKKIHTTIFDFFEELS